MIESAVLYTKIDLKIKIEQLKKDNFSADIKKHLANKDDPFYSFDNKGPISTFLRTIKATTKSM